MEPIKIIELFSEGKKGRPELCEDLYLVNDAFVCVVDGATNITDQLINGKSPGRFIAEVVIDTIGKSANDLYINEVVDAINANLQIHYRDLGLWNEYSNDPSLAPKAAMALYSKHYNEVWLIGDCQCLIDGEHYQHTKIIDEITANARSLYLEAELKKGKTVEELMERDTGFEYVRPLIRMQYYLENIEPEHQYSFEVLNGFSLPIDQIQRVKVPEDARSIALASDGYPVMRASLAETEQALKDLLQKDPLCIRQYKSAKGLVKGNRSFDDRTYIRFEITE
ncbi:MAG: hypothetical protein ACO1OC_03295 [Tuberibacillus sp.]